MVLKMKRLQSLARREEGLTLVELVVTLVLFAIIATSALGLFISLVNSTIVAKRRAVASTLATNQMEYLKSLPYDSLAVAGGTIYSASPLPATTTKKLDGVTYTIKTGINYVDDAFDGCANYPTQQLKETYCRNYPPPTGAPSPDTNPQDYKIAHVTVTDPANSKLAEVDTQISARVSETASTTGALFVTVIDSTGNPVTSATVGVTNTTVTPNVNLSDTTDTNGVAIFYGMPVDTTNYDFVVTASKTGYSTLVTIAPSGTLQPTYPSQRIFTQQSSYVTLTINPMSSSSLVLEAVNTSGAALPNARIYVKGGYKRYTATTDTSYYFDNMTPSDTRPTTDASGLAAISNLAPGPFIFCGDNGATSCTIGGTTYYLAAALPYSGDNPFNPVSVPAFSASAPTYAYGAGSYIQKVRLILTTVSSFPRIKTMNPYDASIASGTLSNFTFTMTGVNLPCTASGAGCGTTVQFTQGATVYTAACTGSSAGTQLNCTVDLSGATAGDLQISVTANGNTLTLPVPPPQGALSVTP